MKRRRTMTRKMMTTRRTAAKMAIRTARAKTKIKGRVLRAPIHHKGRTSRQMPRRGSLSNELVLRPSRSLVVMNRHGKS